MDLVNKLKHMVVEEDDEKKIQPHSQSQEARLTAQGAIGSHVTQVTPSIPIPLGSVAVVPAQASDLSTDKLKMLREATDFDSTRVGMALKKFLAPLESVGLDEKTKFKAAIAQAAAQDPSITVQSVLSTFDSMLKTLEQQQALFSQSASNFEASELSKSQHSIQDLTDRIAQKKKELEDLTAQLNAATAELTDAKQREERAKSEFTWSYNVRLEEIQKQRSSYETLLKG